LENLADELLQALGAGSLLGFVSVLLDAEPKWGARLDSLRYCWAPLPP
jgi:hypothetical protein